MELRNAVGRPMCKPGDRKAEKDGRAGDRAQKEWPVDTLLGPPSFM